MKSLGLYSNHECPIATRLTVEIYWLQSNHKCQIATTINYWNILDYILIINAKLTVEMQEDLPNND